MILMTRVDCRLLHGQVAVSWTSGLGADCILIANDEVVTDDLRKTTGKTVRRKVGDKKYCGFHSGSK